MGVYRFIKRYFTKIESSFYKRDDKIWVFGEWNGQRCCDNSLFLANYIVNHHKDIKAYWITNVGTDTTLLDSKIEVIDRQSREAIPILKKAKVVVMNQGLLDFSDDLTDYFGNSITVNLWHGVPWKKIFLDAYKSKGLLKYIKTSVVFASSKAKCYLSPSRICTDIMCNAAKLRNSQIIEAGYPRNSLFYDANMVDAARCDIIKAIGEQIINDDTKIITYMPTFRDGQEGTFSFHSFGKKRELLNILQENNAVIIEKAHFVNKDVLCNCEKKHIS